MLLRDQGGLPLLINYATGFCFRDGCCPLALSARVSRALRDMVPNHLFQLLSLIAMEPPRHFDAHNVRSEKDGVLAAIQTQSEEEALKNSARGQYTAGKIGDTAIPDYRKTPDVRPDSATETYVAMKLNIDNWRWAGVPFYLRTGKALAMKRTEVAIKFRETPFAMFR
jgi:glucose-6-phosphate 1-dehydrogenase